MRRAVLALTVSALIGAAFAVVGALAGHWWATRHQDVGTPRRYVDYLPVRSPGVDWTRLLVPAAVAGAALALVLTAVIVAVRRRISVPPASRGSR